MKELQDKIHQETENAAKLRKTNAELKTTLKRQEDMAGELSEKVTGLVNARDALEREKVTLQAQLESFRVGQSKQEDIISYAENRTKQLQEKVSERWGITVLVERLNYLDILFS